MKLCPQCETPYAEASRSYCPQDGARLVDQLAPERVAHGAGSELAVNRQELQDLLSEVAFTRPFRFDVRAIADGVCVLNVPFQEAFERPGGIVSGQVFMTAADVAMWLAIKTRLGLSDRSVTTEMKTNFLSSVRREDFLCTAKILKLGRRLVYGVAECRSHEEKLLAHHTLTYLRPE